MNKAELSRVRRVLARSINEDLTTQTAIAVGFTRRLRAIKPFELFVALLAAFGTRSTKTIADLVRLFNLMAKSAIAYKPFHNQLRKAQFPLWVEAMTFHLLASLAQQALRAVRTKELRAFKDIIIQDATWFAVRDELAAEFPGKYVDTAPAAIAVHTTMSLFRDQPLKLTLAGSAHSEQRYRPGAEGLRGCLFLADRGYRDRLYCHELDQAGARFVIRFSKNSDPFVFAVWVGDKRLRRPPAMQLVECMRKLRGKNADLDVGWLLPHNVPVRVRIVLRWNASTQEHVILATNLARSRFPDHVVARLYRLRWQIELVFKEWKSYANLHKFDTRMPAIAQGLVWAAIAAAALKRFVAYAAQRVHEADLSTQRVAMAVGQPLFALLSQLLTGNSIATAVRDLLHFLSTQARRAHPARDRGSGRLAVGLAPAFADSG